eukprot:scaffold214_cov249-Pinguiococcus_pyrenoidosus.AAC.36
MDAAVLAADDRRVEEHLGGAEALGAELKHRAVRQGVHHGAHATGGPLLGHRVESDVTSLLLDLPHEIPLGGRHEGIAASPEKQLQLLRHFPAGHIHARDGMRQRET